MTDKKDAPNVIAPPPLIFSGGLLLGGFVAWHHPFPVFPPTISLVVGFLLSVVGTGVIVTTWRQMNTAKTNIEPWKPTTAILDSGLFGISRNPIYVAMILIYLGVTCLFNSIWFLPFLPIVLLIIYFGVILREEKYLESKFGDEYLNYKKRVRRWI
jgi:protein-S-isoprenylcysteine O-methyltransferase Ste14